MHAAPGHDWLTGAALTFAEGSAFIRFAIRVFRVTPAVARSVVGPVAPNVPR